MVGNRNKKKWLSFWSGCCLLVAFSACLGSTGSEKGIKTDDIFFDYKVWGEEGNDSVTITLQFRYGGQYGPTIALEEPAFVALDGERLSVDSSSITGPIYQVTKAVSRFTGKHNIVFTDSEKKTYKESFVFRPFTLRSPMPDTVYRKRLNLEFSGLEKEDYVRVLMTDTSFLGDGINRVDTVLFNRMMITREDFSKLADGPIQLEFIREEERVVEKSTEAGGYISIVYTIRREFFLRDRP